jgi:hypothetical protein
MTFSPNNINPIRVAQGLFFMNAVLWLLFGIISIAQMADSNSEQEITMGIFAALMVGNIAAMVISGIWLGKAHKQYYYFALMVLTVNVILTVTDEYGLFYIITLLIDLVLFGLLIAARKRYSLPSGEDSLPG